MATKKVKTVKLEDVLKKDVTPAVLREKEQYRSFINDWPDTSTASAAYYVPEIKADSDGMYCEFNLFDGSSYSVSLSFSAFDDEYIYNRAADEDEDFEERLRKMLDNVDNLYSTVKSFKESVNEAANALRIARKVNK